MIIEDIIDFIAELNENARKSQLAAGFAWGVLFGLVPSGNVFWVALFVISFFLRHNQVAKLLALAILKCFSAALGPLMDTVGWEVLHIESLQPLFTTLYNLPFVPFTKFNNTMVAGGVVCGVILWLPVFLLFLFLIPFYRDKVAPKIRELPPIKAARRIPVVKWVINYIDGAGME